MDVAEAKEPPCPAEPELTFQRDGVRLAAERTSQLVTRKELEAEGTAGMEDRRNDGRGAWMASEGAGHGRRQAPRCFPRGTVVYWGKGHQDD